MNLVHLQVELQWLRPLFERLVDAVERIAGPVPKPQPAPYQSTLADYSFIPTDEFARIDQEKFAFAVSQQIVPGSEAFIAKVLEYEQAIIASYGDADGTRMVNQLPWKIRTNPIPTENG